MDDEKTEANPGYAFGQMAAAFATARSHPDAETRTRALTRMERWGGVLQGIAAGRLHIGSRTPVDDLPAWVTPEVLRGGFASGAAAAERPLEADELAVVTRHGLPRTREALFAHWLSPAGLAELDALLTSGRYEVRLPEEAALLTVAWLVRTGEVEAAAALAAELTPFADRLRFVPAGAEDRAPLDVVWREPAGAAREHLAARTENPRIAAMRETLTVWNPLADDLLALWLETVRGGRVAAVEPPGWARRAQALLARYDELAARHRRAGRHRSPKSNLGILLAATRAAPELEPRRRGFLQATVDAMLAKRGAPGSEPHAALRDTQAAVAALPAHDALARVVAARLAPLPAARGVAATDPLLVPVAAAEAIPGAPAGAGIPPSVRRVVRRTREGTPEVLVEEGVVGSAEVLATLVPRIAAAAVAVAHPEDARTLVAANYVAFRRRRSLLLLDLEHQVRLHELPWVAALAPHRAGDAGAAAGALAALRRLAELTLGGFPATILPSPMVTELAALAAEAGLALPWTEELAADIFMGRFSAKFPAAARLAQERTRGTLYARYYGTDEALGRDFAASCRRRAGLGADAGWSVAANGMVIEQAQILTTHNLATLAGLELQLDWLALAEDCLATIVVLHGRLAGNPRANRTVKDMAYAWRQLVFFLALVPAAGQRAFTEAAARSLPPALAPALDGLRLALGGDTVPAAHRFVGWSTGRHWLLA